MTDTLFATIPGPCGTCGRPASDGRCPWCDDATTGAEAGRKAAKAAADADPVFAHWAAKALAVCRDEFVHTGFTSVDVRDTLESWDVPVTRPAALGAVFNSAHRAGVIVPTGEFRPSPIKSQHGRPLRVWRAA